MNNDVRAGSTSTILEGHNLKHDERLADNVVKPMVPASTTTSIDDRSFTAHETVRGVPPTALGVNDETRMGINNSDSSNVVAELLQQQIGLLREQQAAADDIRTLLREMNDREAAADLSRKPIPPVTAQSSSAWNPLLNSTLSRIELIIDRWRGSVDVLLVFVGLFSTIVTSFFVDSLQRLSPNQGARTNELLVNLTEITIQLSGIQASRLHITSPIPFVPDASDVRINAYWSLALVISISAAALAVAGRAFLGTLTKSTGKPHERLTDISRRWKQAEVLLGPALETLPAILTIPVILFLVGLLENVFSAALLSHRISRSLIICASISAATIFLVGVTLFYALIHAYRHPETSPFRTTLSQVIRAFVERISSRPIRASFHWLVAHCRPPISMPDAESQPKLVWYINSLLYTLQASIRQVVTHINRAISLRQSESQDEPQPTEIDADKLNQNLPVADHTYHTTLQATHDDDSLDRAAAALASICADSETRKLVHHGVFIESFRVFSVILSGLETKSIVHLLSPEASYRCNLTAAECISVLNAKTSFFDRLCTDSNRLDLLLALLEAARRESSLSNSPDVWYSVFFRLFTTLVHSERRWIPGSFSYIFEMLRSGYVYPLIDDSLRSVRSEEERKMGVIIIQMTFSWLHDAVWRTSPHNAHADILPVIKKLSGQFTLQGLERPLRPTAVIPLDATVCLCLWDGVHDKVVVNHDVPRPDESFMCAVVQWIWSIDTPTNEDIVAIINMPRPALWPGRWLGTVLEELIRMMERRQTWHQFDTCVLAAVAQLLSDFTTDSGRLHLQSLPSGALGIIEIVGYIGSHLDHLYLLRTRDPEMRWSWSTDKLYILASGYAFSALLEMLFTRCQTRAIEELSLADIDAAVVLVLGPRRQITISNLDVAMCCTFWDGKNIFSKEKIRDKACLQLRSFIAAFIRWLWSDDRTSAVGIQQHVHKLQRIYETFDLLPGGHPDNVLISLLEMEHNRTHTLDQVFVLLRKGMGPFALDTLDFITNRTRSNLQSHTPNPQNYRPFTRTQAGILIETYRGLHFPPLSLDDEEPILKSFRTLWADLYGSAGIGLNGTLIVPDPFPDDTCIVETPHKTA